MSRRAPGRRACAQGLGQRFEALGAQSLHQGRGLPGRRRAVSAAPCGTGREPGVVFGPLPVGTGPGDRDPGRDTVLPDDHAPVLADGVDRVRARREIDPADQGGLRRERGLDLLQLGHLARQRPVVSGEPGLTRPGILPSGPALRSSNRSVVGLVAALGVVATCRSSRCSGGGQIRGVGLARRCEPPVRAGGQTSSGRPSRSSSSRRHAAAGCPRRASTAAGAGRLGSRDPLTRPRPVASVRAVPGSQTAGSTGRGLGVLPLGVEVERQVVVAGGGVGVVCRPAALRRIARALRVQGLGVGVLPLGVEVDRQVVVAGGGVGVVVRPSLRPDGQGLLVAAARRRRTSPGHRGSPPGCCGWWRCRGGPRPAPPWRIARACAYRGSASAYFPWAPRLSRQVVVAGGGVGVVARPGALRIARACSYSGSASAYFPWALRLHARLLWLVAVSGWSLAQHLPCGWPGPAR